ncbi:MAG: hypothetical protein KDK12_14740 [Rhodobacteraceae bacterium]|nr:hypothetical protein [Paracoccaceae bacterium]
MSPAFGGHDYAFQMASDVIRDGLGLEAWQQDCDPPLLVLEVFRQDPSGALSYNQFVPGLPFDLIEHVVGIARADLLKPGWNEEGAA